MRSSEPIQPTATGVLQARSTDAALLARLAASGWRGRVHSVFTRTLNLETPTGTLVTLAGRDCDNAPDTVVVDAPDFTGFGVAADDVVTACRTGIAIAQRLHVRFDGTLRWRGDLPPWPIDAGVLSSNVEFVHEQLLAAGTPGGMLAAAGMADPWTAEVTRMLAARADQVRLSLVRGDAAAFRAHAPSLIGLGPGLTPSGDDFLVDLFAALHLDGPGASFAPLCAPIVVEGAAATNAISLAALRHAAHGRVRESIRQLLWELTQGSPAQAAVALKRVLAIGSTSGTDIAAGILCGAGIHLAPAASPRTHLSPAPAPAVPAQAPVHS
jgi:hypothetical protein